MLVGRMLNIDAKQHHATGHPLTGLFDANLHKKGQDYCRVGYYAKTIRRAIIDLIKKNVNRQTWKLSRVGKDVLTQNNRLSPKTCAKLAILAFDESRKDWCSECDLFNATKLHHSGKDWHDEAWENTYNNHADKRSVHLDKHFALSEQLRAALYGDGGYVPGSGATYAAQPRLFGQDSNYFNNSSAASRPVLARLPNRFGYETCTIHTAEMAAMVASLRWRRKGG